MGLSFGLCVTRREEQSASRCLLACLSPVPELSCAQLRLLSENVSKMADLNVAVQAQSQLTKFSRRHTFLSIFVFIMRRKPFFISLTQQGFVTFCNFPTITGIETCFFISITLQEKTSAAENPLCVISRQVEIYLISRANRI